MYLGFEHIHVCDIHVHWSDFIQMNTPGRFINVIFSWRRCPENNIHNNKTAMIFFRQDMNIWSR